MSCPFFMPTDRSSDIEWPHRSRLPLGEGWRGSCHAPGHEGSLPTVSELKEFCNLGYAAGCPRLPAGRAWDAVRFGLLPSRDSQVLLRYVGELGHRPVGQGVLEYDRVQRQWTVSHPLAQIQRMAECYLQSHLEAAGGAAAASPAAEDL